MSFAKARPSIIRLGQDIEEARSRVALAKRSPTIHGVKRKAVEADMEPEQFPRKTRSQQPKVSEERKKIHIETVDGDDDAHGFGLQPGTEPSFPCAVYSYLTRW